MDFLSVPGTTCVESDDGLDTMAVDTDPIPLGFVRYYLLRAEDECPDGKGTLGMSSASVVRLGRNCP